MFIPVPRVTVLIPSGPDHDPDRKHLFVVLTTPFEDPVTGKKCVLLVSISSVRAGSYADQTCRLFPGDHAFIKQESYVQYSTARIEAVDSLIKGEKAGKLVRHDMMDEGVFARICKGLDESPHVAPKLLAVYKASKS